MKWRRPGRRALAALLVLACALQLIPVERSNPAVSSDVGAPAAVDSILRRACYDCHSNETRWPWYSAVAPVSWRVVSHVDAGRADLNFSEWPAFDFELQDLEFEEIRDQIKERRMPPWDYVLLHPEARLDERDRERVLDWASVAP